MNDNRIVDDTIRRLRPSGASSPAWLKVRAETQHQLQKYIHTLGPTPKRCLETLADLGLSDIEIGRYFRIPHEVVTQLREGWKIDGNA